MRVIVVLYMCSIEVLNRVGLVLVSKYRADNTTCYTSVNSYI